MRGISVLRGPCDTSGRYPCLVQHQHAHTFGLPPTDTWLGSLLAEDTVDLSALREMWLVNVTAVFNARLPGIFAANSTAAILLRMHVLDTLVLATVKHPNHGLGDVFTADPSVLPDAAHVEVFMVRLKTLRLVFYDASRASADPGPFDPRSVTLRFQSMLRQLEGGTSTSSWRCRRGSR